jgi:hypothetical protein
MRRHLAALILNWLDRNRPTPRVVNVTITGVTDPETVGRQVTEMLRRHDRR